MKAWTEFFFINLQSSFFPALFARHFCSEKTKFLSLFIKKECVVFARKWRGFAFLNRTHCSQPTSALDAFLICIPKRFELLGIIPNPSKFSFWPGFGIDFCFHAEVKEIIQLWPHKYITPGPYQTGVRLVGQIVSKNNFHQREFIGN